MSKLLGSFGDSITQTVSGIFPEGDIGNITKYAISAISGVGGPKGVAQVIAAQNFMMKKIWGGLAFPGTVNIYDDKIEFEPAFYVKIPIYQGIQAISIPHSDIISIEKIRKGLFKISGIRIEFYGGEFLIIAPFATDRMLSILNKC